MKRIYYLLSLACLGLLITWLYKFSSAEQRTTEHTKQKVEPVLSSVAGLVILPHVENSPEKSRSTTHSNKLDKNKPTCITNDDIQKIDDQWNESMGTAVDEDGHLFPEQQFLENLDNEDLTSLAEQYYPAAMATLSIRLMASETPELVETGRKWAMKAAVHGKLQTLNYLAFSYLNEFQALENTKQSEKAHAALQNYRTSLLLLEDVAPNSTIGIDMLDHVELVPTEKKKLAKQATAIIQSYQQQRSNLGLHKLTITAVNTGLENGQILCPNNQ